MTGTTGDVREWQKRVIKDDQIRKYLTNGTDFIDDARIASLIGDSGEPDPGQVRDILKKALEIKSLSLEDTAALLRVRDAGLWKEIFAAGVVIKSKVYDNRVVTFAPLYCGNLCLNNCVYCGFRRDNAVIQRRVLTFEEIERETRTLAGELGHKRLVAVYGEHPSTGAEYICESMRRIYSVHVPVRKGRGEIRRVNINAAPMSIEDLKKIHEAGIGTYQVFQETYHRQRYQQLHPAGTLKSNYRWRLYALHRAMDAGIDDVAVGTLFGLSDWRFDVMGMVAHALDLERQFGIGPHTVSVPRIEPAANTLFPDQAAYKVSDDDFKKLVAVLRCAIPYAGLIVTCRESPQMMRDLMPLYTQRDASSKIGIGAYSDGVPSQQERKQQFILGDTRSLDEVVRELAAAGHIISFCTAGYRCGRTGKNIMPLLRTGKEGCFCKLNAILTFQEWLEDFASDETRAIGEKVIASEIEQVKSRVPDYYTPSLVESMLAYHRRIKNGERDLCF